MRMPCRSERIPWWLFGAAVLVVYGFMAAKHSRDASDSRTEIVALFEGDEGTVLRMPGGHPTGNDLESPIAAGRVQKAGVNVGRNRFQETDRKLESSESDDGAPGFDVSEIHSLMGRVAWVRGQVTARNGRKNAARPFVAVLVKVGGEWRTVFDLVGSQNAVEQRSENRAACSCKPCKDCSPRKHG